MFLLNLVTPEKKIVTDLEIDEVIVPGYRGQLDILPGHAPLVTTLSTGIVKYRPKGSAKMETAVVSWATAKSMPMVLWFWLRWLSLLRKSIAFAPRSSLRQLRKCWSILYLSRTKSSSSSASLKRRRPALMLWEIMIIRATNLVVGR